MKERKSNGVCNRTGKDIEKRKKENKICKFRQKKESKKEGRKERKKRGR